MTTIDTNAPEQAAASTMTPIARPSHPWPSESVVTRREITVSSAELSKLLNRALNTMEPKDWPSWVNDLLGGHAQGGKIAQGMLTAATCTIVADIHRDEAVSA